MGSDKKTDSRPTVLIVDDDDLLRNFYSRVLTAEGYNPVCATNGDEAISVLEKCEEDIKLSIIDLLMPVRTGWELIQYMKKNDKFRGIPIIAITGLAASFDEFEKVKSTCQAVMHKGDFDLNKFKDTIKLHLKK